MTLFVQVLVFAEVMLTGVLLGFWFDLYRFINRRGKTPIPSLLDLLFWAVVTSVVFVVLININYLELRLYVFCSLALGMYLYLKLLSRHILNLYAWAFAIIINMIKWLWRILRPIALPFRAAAGFMDLISRAILAGIARTAITIRDFAASRQDNPPAA